MKIEITSLDQALLIECLKDKKRETERCLSDFKSDLLGTSMRSDEMKTKRQHIIKLENKAMLCDILIEELKLKETSDDSLSK